MKKYKISQFYTLSYYRMVNVVLLGIAPIGYRMPVESTEWHDRVGNWDYSKKYQCNKTDIQDTYEW